MNDMDDDFQDGGLPGIRFVVVIGRKVEGNMDDSYMIERSETDISDCSEDISEGEEWDIFIYFSAETSRLFFEPGTDGIAPIGNRCPDFLI